MSQGAIIMATKGSMYLSGMKGASICSFFSHPSCLGYINDFVTKKNSIVQLAVLVIKTPCLVKIIKWFIFH